MRPPYAPWIEDPDDPDFLTLEELDEMEEVMFRNRKQWRDSVADAVFWKDVGTFREEDHPRGQPENAGQFGPGGGSSSTTKTKTRPTAIAALRNKREKEGIPKTGAEKRRAEQFEQRRSLSRTGVRSEQEEREFQSRQTRSIRSQSPAETIKRAHAAGRSVAEQVEHEETKYRKSPEGQVEERARQEAATQRREARERQERPMSRLSKISHHVQRGEIERATELMEQNRREQYEREMAKPVKKGEATKEDFENQNMRISAGGDEEAEATLIKNWNDKIGMTPAEFKDSFLNGLPGEMKISGGYANAPGKFHVSGQVKSPDGRNSLAHFDRDIDVDGKKAYSALFEVNQQYQRTGVGKNLMAGNIDTYEKLGIRKISVTAGLTVGGYAWARYGYVPDQESWNELRFKLKGKLGATTYNGNRGLNTMEAEEWSWLGDDQQQAVQDAWRSDARSGFVQNEIQNWHDSGRSLEEAKKTVDQDLSRSDWADEPMKEWRAEYDADPDNAPIPFTNEEIMSAIDIADYESRYEDGNEDPEITIDDEALNKIMGGEQIELPGIEGPNYAAGLTEKMREDIIDTLTKAFNNKAAELANNMTPPEYLTDQVDEYMDEYWDSMDDRDRLRIAERFDMHNVEAPEDEDEEVEREEPKESIEPEPKSANDPLLDILNDPDPKGIWKVADSSRGEELLLRQGWRGTLNLDDQETYQRFKAYVKKVQREPKAKAS